LRWRGQDICADLRVTKYGHVTSGGQGIRSGLHGTREPLS